MISETGSWKLEAGNHNWDPPPAGVQRPASARSSLQPPASSLRLRGFTLIELLITTSLMALVGGATVAALSGGMRVWERGMEFGVHRQASLIAFDQIRRDLHNARRFAPIPWQATYDQIAFSAAEPDPMRLDAPPEPGRLGYFLDERRQVLCRSFVPYRRVRRERLTDRCHAILEGVTRLRFAYFGADAEGGEPAWRERWATPAMPTAIRVDISLQGRASQAVTRSLVVALMSAAIDEPE